MANALQTKALHQPFDRAVGHVCAFSVHLVPDLASAVDLPVGLPDGLNLSDQPLITLGTGTAQFWIASVGSMAPVARWAD